MRSLIADRLLVRVGKHRDDGLSDFNEQTELRSPCRRLEPWEEFVGVLRGGRIELYQKWVSPSPRLATELILQTSPLRSCFTNRLRLCFVIPLSGNITSLSIFSETDMSISLVTSASKFAAGLERLSHRHTGRSRAMLQRVQQSRQVKWIRRDREGSHVFIIKLGQRSRAIDWYWGIWKEGGGVLPQRIDISVPSLSAQIRLDVDKEQEMGGLRETKAFSLDKVAESCWHSLERNLDLNGEDKDYYRFAWRDAEGVLQWLPYGTTVEGQPRYWALLSTIALWQVRPLS